MNRLDLGRDDVKKLMLTLSVPTIISQMVNMLYNLVDRIYIGHMAPADTVGKLALTGVGLCFPIIMTISAFSALMATGGAPRASIAEGRGNRTGAEKIMGNAFTLLLLSAAILTAVILLFARPLLMLFGGSEHTVGYALDYIRIYALGTVFVQLTMGMNAYITAQGFTSVSMRTTLIGAGLNILLDPLFIFVLDLGVRGAALATILSQAVSTAWVLRFLTGPQTRWTLRREHLRPLPAVFLPCMALGLSPFIMQTTESLISISFNTSLHRYGGDLAVGTMTILTSVMQFAMMPLMGLSQGAQPIISYNFGARNSQRVRTAFRCLLAACLTYSMVFWLGAELFPAVFIRLFNSDSALVTYGAWALRIYLASMGIFGIQIACQQTFVAIGNAKTSLFLAILRKIILLIPLIYILPNFFADKAFAVFLAEPIADLGAVLTTATVFFFQFRKVLREMERKARFAESKT